MRRTNLSTRMDEGEIYYDDKDQDQNENEGDNDMDPEESMTRNSEYN